MACANVVLAEAVECDHAPSAGQCPGAETVLNRQITGIRSGSPHALVVSRGCTRLVVVSYWWHTPHSCSVMRNRYQMKTCLLVLTIFSTCQLGLAQLQTTAVINDPDGYTNIRAGKGTSTEIIGKIYDYEVFTYNAQANEQWLEVTVNKCACEDYRTTYFNAIKGYVHRSRILDLESARNSITKEKLSKIFNRELELYEKRESLTNRQSDDFKIISNRWTVFHEMIFDQVLDKFSDYICSTQDEELFELYNNIITTESASADELPSFAIGRIFKCQPDWTLQRIPKSHEYFYLLEWGCQGVSDKDHQLKLNEYRTIIGLEQVDYDNYQN